MSMTEQEIRADERERIAKDIEGLPGRFAEAPQPACAMVARYIRAETPGGWRAWSGLYEPDADRNLMVEIERRNGDRCINKVRAFDGWLWQAFNQGRDIIRWRLPVAKPEPAPASGGWKQWRGGLCPVSAFSQVDVKYRNGLAESNVSASGRRWSHDGVSDRSTDIVSWRLHMDPKIVIKWSSHPWDAYTKPTKDWRDVPVTAGMLADAVARSMHDPALAATIHAAAQAKVAP